MLNEFEDRQLRLFDGLTALESASTLLARSDWSGKRPVDNNEICSAVIMLWKYRGAMKEAVATKLVSIRNNNPKLKLNSDQIAENMAQNQLKQILFANGIRDVETFSKMLVKSEPVTLGFTFSHTNPESDEFTALMDFVEKAIAD